MENPDYKLILSRRKTLSLTVTQEGETVVRAPLKVSREYVREFVEKHREWIEKQRAAIAARETLDLRDGACLTLFGSKYLIRCGRARIGHGELFLPGTNREEALVRLLKRFSLEVMEIVTARIAAHCGFCYRSVRISSARGRWGSCNRDGVISYSFRVAFLPPELSEYVAVHELAHTVFFNHSPAFWQEVERVIPDRKARQKRLKSSPAMTFL